MSVLVRSGVVAAWCMIAVQLVLLVTGVTHRFPQYRPLLQAVNMTAFILLSQVLVQREMGRRLTRTQWVQLSVVALVMAFTLWGLLTLLG